eukprot:2102002-Rhodomonas_salina.1
MPDYDEDRIACFIKVDRLPSHYLPRGDRLPSDYAAFLPRVDRQASDSDAFDAAIDADAAAFVACCNANHGRNADILAD